MTSCSGDFSCTFSATRMGMQSRSTGPEPILLLAVAVLLVFSQMAQPQEATTDWAARVRAQVDNNRLDQAASLVDSWLKAYPADLDARGWHARLQAWTNHWREAEAEYRELLQQLPDDVDLLAGLADLLMWQGRHEEAIPLLERACSLVPDRNDCRLRLARAQQRAGRLAQARASYRQVLARDAGSREAEAGLAQLQDSGRHAMNIGMNADILDYAQEAGAGILSFDSRWNGRFSTTESITQFRRFGKNATLFEADARLHGKHRGTFSLGGALGRDNAVIPRSEARFEYSRGFFISESGPVRGVEAIYGQRWLWFRDARVMILSPGAVLYLPKDWNWLFRLSAARNHLGGAGSQWQPGGWTRLSFPVTRILSGNLLFASGTENFSLLDQILASSALTWGVGFRLRLAPGREIAGDVRRQNRSQGQTQTSLSFSYAVRF